MRMVIDAENMHALSCSRLWRWWRGWMWLSSWYCGFRCGAKCSKMTKNHEKPKLGLGHFEIKKNKFFCNQPLCDKSYSMSTASTNLIVKFHLSNRKNKYGTKAQNKLSKYYLNFLIHDLQSFHLSQSQAFLQFCHALNSKYKLRN